MSKEPHIIYKLIKILITVQNAERYINKKTTWKSRILNTQYSLTPKEKKNSWERKKNPYLCSKNEKTIEPCQKKKLPFVNFQTHFLTPSPLWIKHTDINKKCLLKPDIFPINENPVRLGFTKIGTFTGFPGFFQFFHFHFPFSFADQLFASAFGFGKWLIRSPLTNYDILLNLVQ